MNYLAHLFLGPHEAEPALGSLLGDFVRGPLQAIALPAGVRGGIWLHRRIDAFTDAHPLVLASRQRVSAERRRYAGIMIDMFYDHLLVRHWSRFSSQPMPEFTAQMYNLLLAQQELIPTHALPVIRRMAEQDWLSSYGQLPSLHRAVDAIARRFRHSNPLPGGVHELERCFSGFEADFLAFMPEVMAFARDQAAELISSAGASSISLQSNPSA